MSQQIVVGREYKASTEDAYSQHYKSQVSISTDVGQLIQRYCTRKLQFVRNYVTVSFTVTELSHKVTFASPNLNR